MGTPSDVRDYLVRFAAEADADELMTVHHSPTVQGRLRSVRLTAEATGAAAAEEQPVSAAAPGEATAAR